MFGLFYDITRVSLWLCCCGKWVIWRGEIKNLLSRSKKEMVSGKGEGFVLIFKKCDKSQIFDLGAI